jgi:hypothetical protein
VRAAFASALAGGKRRVFTMATERPMLVAALSVLFLLVPALALVLVLRHAHASDTSGAAKESRGAAPKTRGSTQPAALVRAAPGKGGASKTKATHPASGLGASRPASAQKI